MNIKITGSSGAQKTDKSKKSGKSSAANKAKFDSLLDSLMQTQGADGVDHVQAVSGGEKSGQSYIPQDAAERSAWMLEKLEKLYADILAGAPTAAAKELREALATAVENRDDLPEELKQLVNEIDVRSAVEIAKLEASAQPKDD